LLSDNFSDIFLAATTLIGEVVIRSAAMTEGLFDRYFRLLAGQLPPAEYGVIADSTEESVEAAAATSRECLC
jgi:hypothetical protein